MANDYYDNEPFTRRNKKKLGLLAAMSVCRQELLVIQIVRDYRKYQYSGDWGKKLVPYLLAKVYKVTTTTTILLEMNWYILAIEVFRSCIGSLTLCAQAHD